MLFPFLSTFHNKTWLLKFDPWLIYVIQYGDETITLKQPLGIILESALL